MKELFLNILTASLQGSIVIGVILLLRLVLKKAPKKTICLLWLLAALRLLLPFEIQSSLSLQPSLDGVTVPGSEYAQQITSGFQSGSTDVILPPMEMEDAPVQKPDIDIVEQPEQSPVTYEIQVPLKVRILENYEQILLWLWAAGVIGLLIYSAAAYALLKGKVRSSVVFSEGVWICGKVDSAFVLGFFRPQIYLSAALPEDARAYVLAHEKCHIRRGDHWWKLIGFVTLALHWFNPLVWLAYTLLCRDLEMACDEAVVGSMTAQQRKAYSAALLNCSAPAIRIAACPVAFGEVSVKQRIKNVLNYRRPAFWITAAALVSVVIVAVCFLTSPENGPDLSFLNYENAISTVADQDKVTTIYCDETSIIPSQVDGNALAKYLDNANWKQRRWEPRDQSSPGSVEFVISDDYRITVFDRNFARVTYCGDVRYYRITQNDYESAIQMLQPQDITVPSTEPSEAPADDVEALISACRDAMVTLQNAESGYQHIVNMDEPRDVINTYLYDGENWCFKYRRPNWDYQDVIMLAYEGKLYTFEGDPIDDAVKAPIHYWKPDESGDIEPFLLYPFDLNWAKIPLNFLSSGSNEEGKTVTVEYPEYLDVFTFCFDSTGELLWFEIGDSSGEPEATTTRVYVQYPGESISDYLLGMHSEATNTVNENELVYKDSFYQDMFLPESSPLNAAELFYGFYQNPQRFIERLAATEDANPGVTVQVIECMGREVNNYAPGLFQHVVNLLPDTCDPKIVKGLKEIFEEKEQETQTGDGLDNDGLLKKCQTALEKQQAKDYFQIMDNIFFSGGEGANHSGSTLWYVYKDTFLCQSQSEGLPEAGEWWNLYCDGSYYHRKAHTSTGPQFGLSWESDWENGHFNAAPLPSTLWPLEFDFATAQITQMEAYADEYGESITIAVSGDPLLQGGTPQHYIVVFHLNTHGVLQRVQMQYMYGDAQVERILVFRTTTREEVMDMIGECHDEALLHTKGICTDPNCTDKSHDHSQVDCTDDHCDNPTHHHRSHH